MVFIVMLYMKRIFWLSIFAGAFASCQNNPKTAATQDTINTVTASPDGYYETSLPAASTPGRMIALTLRPTGDAVMLTDYLNQTPEILQIGNWTMRDDTVLLSMVTVGSGDPVKDSLRFRLSDSSLIYEGQAYGEQGLMLTRREKPAPAEKMLLIWVKSEAECDRGPGFGKTKCYEVQYGDKRGDTWEKLSEPIDGFSFEKGFVYQLEVRRIPRDGRIQDIGAYEYRLARVLTKEKA